MSKRSNKATLPALGEWEMLPADERIGLFSDYFTGGGISNYDFYRLTSLTCLVDEGKVSHGDLERLLSLAKQLAEGKVSHGDLERLLSLWNHVAEERISTTELQSLSRLADLSKEVTGFGRIVRELADTELGKKNPSLMLLLIDYYQEAAATEGAFFHTQRILRSIKGEGKYANVSFSQEGEDLILKKIFRGKSNGTYVDVGAYHPAQYSNTYAFYLAGWRGINIEPNEESVAMFRQDRPEDINLSYAVGSSMSPSTYFEFDEAAYNTFSEERVAELKKQGILPSRRRTIPEKVPLSDVFEKHLKDRSLDLLDIDVEGLEAEILETAELSVWRPKVILVEQVEREVKKILGGTVHNYLSEFGYMLMAQTFSTCVYVREG